MFLESLVPTCFLKPDLNSTVQTFNSCTRRPDICQCLAVQTLIDNMPKSKPSTPMTKPSFLIKATLSCEVIHASMHKKLGKSCVRSCIMPGLPRHLVQELKAGTVTGLGVNICLTSSPMLVLGTKFSTLKAIVRV